MLGLGKEIYKISLEDLLMPESKEVLKIQNNDAETSQWDTGLNLKEFSVDKAVTVLTTR